MAATGTRTPAGPPAAERSAGARTAILQLLAVWPAEWTAPQREIADQWLRTVAVQAGWPQQRLAAPAPASDADDAGPALSDLLGHCGDSQHPCLAIVLAAASHLSENSIASLSAQNGLFSATHPQGRIPGEGAAGLLLADAAHASLITGRDDSGSMLQTIASGRRSASADDAKRDTDTCLAQAAEQALHNARLDGAAVTGHRRHGPPHQPRHRTHARGHRCRTAARSRRRRHQHRQQLRQLWRRHLVNRARRGGCGSTGPRRSCALHQ
jgi:hypothetical protein